MKWFSAKFIHKAEVLDDRKCAALFEETIRVFMANDRDQAVVEAERLGREEEIEYANEEGTQVRWVLLCVEDVQELEDSSIGHGTEVYSRLYRLTHEG